MNTLSLAHEHTPKIGDKVKHNEFWVLTSVRGVKAISTSEKEVDEAIKLGKFKVDSGNGHWGGIGPSSTYASNPHLVKLDKVEHIVQSIITEGEIIY